MQSSKSTKEADSRFPLTAAFRESAALSSDSNTRPITYSDEVKFFHFNSVREIVSRVFNSRSKNLIFRIDPFRSDFHYLHRVRNSSVKELFFPTIRMLFLDALNPLGSITTDEENLFTQTTYGASVFATAPLSEFFFKKRAFTQFSRIGLTYQFRRRQLPILDQCNRSRPGNSGNFRSAEYHHQPCYADFCI